MTQDENADGPEWELLTRYLTGELSPAEAAAVDRWFEADPQHRLLLEELRGVWLAAAGETSGWRTERAVVELRRHALGMEHRPRTLAAGARARRVSGFTTGRRRAWMKLAAGVAAGLVIGGAVSLGLHSRDGVSAARFGAPGRTTDVATRRAQRAEVRLADGSRVILGPGSRLSYATDFGRRDRTLFLHGEAYFDVVHDEAKPFRVRTAGGVAEDVGTKFVVRARATPLQVMVAEGAIVLRPTQLPTVHDSLLLTAGQLGQVLGDGRLSRASAVDPEAYLAWTRGELVFKDAPLADVAEELSLWYDVDVRVADSAGAARRFSGRLGSRSVEETVRLVAAVANVSVRRTERGWAFQGGKSS